VAREGRIFVKDHPALGMEWAVAARIAFSRAGPVVGTGSYQPPKNLGGDFKGGAVGTSPAYSFSTAIAEVTVDLETGYVTVDRFTDFSDAGTVINPVTFHGQVEGSIVMGMGEALLEDTVVDAGGRLANPNLHDYLIPTIRETPEIRTVAVESYEPHGPFGAKEAGEGSLAAFLPALTNAIADAIGIRFNDLPVTPDRVFEAIEKRKRALAKAPKKDGGG